MVLVPYSATHCAPFARIWFSGAKLILNSTVTFGRERRVNVMANVTLPFHSPSNQPKEVSLQKLQFPFSPLPRPSLLHYFTKQEFNNRILPTCHFTETNIAPHLLAAQRTLCGFVMKDLQHEKCDHPNLSNWPSSEVKSVRIVVISHRNIAKNCCIRSAISCCFHTPIIHFLLLFFVTAIISIQISQRNSHRI